MPLDCCPISFEETDLGSGLARPAPNSPHDHTYSRIYLTSKLLVTKIEQPNINVNNHVKLPNFYLCKKNRR